MFICQHDFIYMQLWTYIRPIVYSLSLTHTNIHRQTHTHTQERGQSVRSLQDLERMKYN